MAQNASIPNRLRIASTGKIQYVDIASILYCTGDNNYTEIYVLGNDNAIVCSKTLKKMETELNSPLFFRISKQNLVNLAFVTEYLSEKGGCALLVERTKLHVARRRRREFLEAWGLKNL